MTPTRESLLTMLLEKVRVMRQAQREYYRNRLPGDLTAAKSMEREVDSILHLLDVGTKAAQSGLFGPEVPT